MAPVVCQGCGIFIGTSIHVCTYQSEQLTFRYRLCLACAERLTEQVGDAAEQLFGAYRRSGGKV